MSPLLCPEESCIRVAEFLTKRPPREVLEKKLKAAVAIARESRYKEDGEIIFACLDLTNKARHPWHR
jgi:hypothetical protein